MCRAAVAGGADDSLYKRRVFAVGSGVNTKMEVNTRWKYLAGRRREKDEELLHTDSETRSVLGYRASAGGHVSSAAFTVGRATRPHER